MRYDSTHKQQTRTKVLEAAAKAIRLSGPERVGVAGVMADAGLTHGGFYAHFASKDDLVAAVIGHMFEQMRARLLRETEGRGTAEGLAAYIDFYLSRRHRDARDLGCPIAALASDLPRLGDAARAIYADGVSGLAAELGAMLGEIGHDDAATLGRSVVAELVGALALARAEPDARRSDATLAASRHHLKRRLGLESRS
jgi:TetR/AcrR family transcriptional repressor of nem operon